MRLGWGARAGLSLLSAFLKISGAVTEYFFGAQRLRQPRSPERGKLLAEDRVGVASPKVQARGSCGATAEGAQGLGETGSEQELPREPGGGWSEYRGQAHP